MAIHDEWREGAALTFAGDPTRPRALVNLVVSNVDRLARSMKQLIETIEKLRLRGIGFGGLTEAFDTATAQAAGPYHMFGTLAEFERGLIRERAQAGLAAARRIGRAGDRPEPAAYWKWVKNAKGSSASGRAPGFGAGASVLPMGGCVGPGLATVSGAIVLAGFTICSGWLRLFNLAATVGFAVFGACAPVFGLGGGARVAAPCGGERVAAAGGGAAEGRIPTMNGAADKVSAFSVIGEAAMPTGSACVWVGAGGIGALADWFVSSPSSRGSIADGVFGRDAAKGCS
ncbi:MAG: recombinase family protein [Methylocystis sp.]